MGEVKIPLIVNWLVSIKIAVKKNNNSDYNIWLYDGIITYYIYTYLVGG